MLFKVIIIIGVVISHVHGHGMMIDPPNRSSVWRFYNNYPINYNDNENFCGGFHVQYETYNGKCGVCGDEYGQPHPQNNEHTGLYGRGQIVAKYSPGQVIRVSIKLTANHRGHFEYSLCEIKNENSYESGEDCFQRLRLADGSDKYMLSPSEYQITNYVQLPHNYWCKHCVLRWHYRSGNNWGWCGDGSGALGCGPQETFRSCSDISIG